MTIIRFSELRQNFHVFKFFMIIIYLSVFSPILFSPKLYFIIDFVCSLIKIFLLSAVNFAHDIVSSSVNLAMLAESSLFIFFLLKKESLILIEYILVH